MDEDELDPPESLVGMLQRGRGAGAIAAAAAPAEAFDTVVDCVRRDPRWDHQVEERAVYYARIVRAHRWPLDALAAHLFDPADARDRDERRTGLTIRVLAALAQAGRGEATTLLRRYVAEGWNWEWALHELADLPWPEAIAGLDEAVLARCTDEELAEVVDPGSPTWNLWAERHERVRDALDTLITARSEAWSSSAVPDCTTLTSLQLRNLVTTRGVARHRAARELARRGDPLLLDLAEEWLPRRPGGPGGHIAGALRLFADRGVLVDRARSWCVLGHPCALDGSGILAEFGDVRDIPVLTAHLSTALDEGWWRAVPELAEGLGRLGAARAEPLLLRAWDVTQYSYARPRILGALIALGLPAVVPIAEESLWDCESMAREHAARTVGAYASRIRDRLAELAGDPLEDDDVRTVARARTAH